MTNQSLQSRQRHLLCTQFIQLRILVTEEHRVNMQTQHKPRTKLGLKATRQDCKPHHHRVEFYVFIAALNYDFCLIKTLSLTDELIIHIIRLVSQPTIRIQRAVFHYILQNLLIYSDRFQLIYVLYNYPHLPEVTFTASGSC